MYNVYAFWSSSNSLEPAHFERTQIPLSNVSVWLRGLKFILHISNRRDEGYNYGTTGFSFRTSCANNGENWHGSASKKRSGNDVCINYIKPFTCNARSMQPIFVIG